MIDSIEFVTDIEKIDPGQLAGFFEGWPDPPTRDVHIAILRGSSHVVCALDGDHVVGFVNAVSDGFFAAFVPMLEVLPSHRGRGIGTELVRRLLHQLEEFYSIDLVCDDDVRPFYERLGLQSMRAMSVRHFDRQSRGSR